MKNKKIILCIVSVLILVAIFAQNVFAVEMGTWKFTEINVTSFPHAIDNNNPEFGLNYDGHTVTQLITQIGDEAGNRKLNAYCGMANVGFEQRNINPSGAIESNVSNPYLDTYQYKYNMSSSVDTASVQKMYSKYKNILALADLFYLGESDSELEKYLKPLLENNTLHYDGYTYENLKEANALITPNQIRAVQQLALWYFTNNIDYTNIDENVRSAFLYYRTTQNGEYTSLAGTNPINNIQNTLTKQLYKYLINKAKTNAANSNYKYVNTVYLYTKKTIDGELSASYKDKSQPIIEIEPGKQVFDLALRKYITKVGNTNIQDRIPNTVTTKLDSGDNTTAEYKHKKNPVTVNEGDKVTYTLTIYNEGDVKGKATQIVDQLPTGLEFDQEATEALVGDNANYTFSYDKTNNKVTISIKAGTTKGLLNEYNGTLDKTSVQVVCTVTAHANTNSDKILTNVAWISEAYNASKNETYKGTDVGFDRDSAPGTTPSVTKDNMESYRGKNNDSKDLANSNEYFEGQQDDDDFEKLVLKPKKMDLALRKFITKIGSKNVENRVPQITGGAVQGQDTTAQKTHPKTKLAVAKGDTVLYTIRVYNEGQVDGYAKEVTDYLPEGLDLKQGSTINSQYKWQTKTNTNGRKIITTDYLASTLIKASNRDYTKLNQTGYYQDLLVECVVNQNATSNNLKNIAAITEAEDKNGNKEDEDSQPEDINPGNYNPKNPENGLGEQDDDDFEDLKIVEFDLALRKYITKVEDEKGTKVELPNISRTPSINNETIRSATTTATYRHRKDPVVVKPGYFVYYNLTVYNEGDIDGFASKITDKLPAGVKYIGIENESTSKYQLESYTENTLILTRKENQGTITAYDGNTLHSETVTIKCQITADAETGADKIYTNIAWISEDHNDKGVADRDSQPNTHPQESGLVTNSTEKGYIGKNNDSKNWANPNEYFEGEQDDDDFEKVVIYSEPEIHKGVKTVENQDSGYYDNNDNKIDTNEPHEWVINSSLPASIVNYEKYEIVDDIDYRLVYQGIISVNIINKQGTKVAELKANTDYKETYTQNTNNPTETSSILGNKYSGTLKLTFIGEGQEISETLKSNAGNIIEVKFSTTFAKDANGKLLAEVVGKEIPNKARLDYTNESGENHKETEKPEVHTGGITLYKYKTSNGTKVGLKDAEFAIYKSKEDAQNRQNAIQTAKSGENGLVKFVGLEYGEDAKDSENNLKPDGTYIQGTESAREIPGTTYWIVENQAPQGYETKKDIIEVTIDNDSYKEDIDVLVREEESKETTNRLIENLPNKFDLALRKYITKVEDEKGENVELSNIERTPNIDKSTIESNTTTATYKHRKDPVIVKPGYTVYYDLTVYNEGNVDGYAKTITDKLPAGVKFMEIKDAEESKYTASYTEETNTLVLTRKDNQGTIQAYDGNTLHSETVTIKCQIIVDAKAGADKIYTNIAWISDDYNERDIDDIDSKPNEYPEEKDLVTDIPDKGYTGKDNDNKDWTNPNEFFEGQQDDDDFEKIIIYSEPEIHKGVKNVENQDSGYYDNNDNKIDTNEPHEWVINSSLPVNIANYKEYEIVDDIDYRLVYGNIISVNIIDKQGAQVAELVENTDYKVTYTPNTEKPEEISDILGNKYSGTLKLTFIGEDQAISDTLNKNAGNIIEVKFSTTFAKDANGKLLAEIIGKEIPNKARLDYTNESGENHKDTEKPEVHTGGITLYKYKKSNGEKVALKDAEFAIYKTKEDAQNKQNAIQTAKSGENGLIEFVGLEYGEDAKDDPNNQKPDGTYIQGEENARVIPGTTYWIVETKAPQGYATIKEPIEVTINNDTYKEDVEVLIKEEESKETTNRLIENKPLNFDLALRKFITKVDDKDVTTRVPQVKYADGKITYEHTKEPVNVVNRNVVTYTLRIFNEGQIDGYASVITDDIPDGVEFLPEHDTNKEYRWVMYTELKEGTEVEDESKVIECKVNGSSETKKYIETTDASKAVIIRTDYLSKEQGEARKTSEDGENPNLLKAFDGSKEISETNPDYKDVKVAFRVTEPNGSKRILINYAQISEDTDENGDEVDDIDSVTDKWNEGEDDQDIEKVRVPEFDLALRKWVTEAIVTEDGKTKVTKTGHDAWDDPEDVVKVEIHRKKLSKVTVKFRYSIRVYNQGEIAGYAKEVTDYIPKGLKFVAKDNPDWKDEGNNVISTRKLENTLLQPGEYADVEVLLTWINGSNNLGLKTNTAEISEDYNEWGVPDKDSTPDNKKPGEDDIDDAPVMLSISTGIEATYIMLGTGILVIIAGGIFLIKKYVL